MSRKDIFYCYANFTSESKDRLLSLALVAPDGSWRYAEVLDVDLGVCDSFARNVVLPRMRRIPGTAFVKHIGIGAFLREAIKSGPEAIEVRLLSSSPLLEGLFQEAASKDGLNVRLQVVEVDSLKLQQFHDHCGGDDRVHGHALVEAIGLALCETERDVQTAFHGAPIRHLELLMGSKNAVSFRAWARAHEKDWGKEHQEAA